MRFSKLVLGFSCLTILFFSCKKDNNTIDTSPHFYFLNGDTTAAKNNIILFGSSDTLVTNIIISSTYPVSSNATITLAPADNYRTSYNSAYNTNYEAMPSNAYSLQTTATATDTSVYDTVQVKFYKSLLTSQHYMLPIQITNAGGNAIDPGTSVIYFYTETSPLSGKYVSNIIRTNYNGDSGINNLSSVDTFSIVKNLVPDIITTSQIDYADLGSNGWRYILSFLNGSLNVSPNSVITSSVQSGSFKILASSFNTTTKKIYIKSTYKNITGNQRIIEETLTLQ